jgi:hypothetical protein
MLSNVFLRRDSRRTGPPTAPRGPPARGAREAAAAGPGLASSAAASPPTPRPRREGAPGLQARPTNPLPSAGTTGWDAMQTLASEYNPASFPRHPTCKVPFMRCAQSTPRSLYTNLHVHAIRTPPVIYNLPADPLQAMRTATRSKPASLSNPLAITLHRRASEAPSAILRSPCEAHPSTANRAIATQAARPSTASSVLYGNNFASNRPFRKSPTMHGDRGHPSTHPRSPCTAHPSTANRAIAMQAAQPSLHHPASAATTLQALHPCRKSPTMHGKRGTSLHTPAGDSRWCNVQLLISWLGDCHPAPGTIGDSPRSVFWLGRSTSGARCLIRSSPTAVFKPALVSGGRARDEGGRVHRITRMSACTAARVAGSRTPSRCAEVVIQRVSRSYVVSLFLNPGPRTGCQGFRKEGQTPYFSNCSTWTGLPTAPQPSKPSLCTACTYGALACGGWRQGKIPFRNPGPRTGCQRFLLGDSLDLFLIVYSFSKPPAHDRDAKGFYLGIFHDFHHFCQPPHPDPPPS